MMFRPPLTAARWSEEADSRPSKHLDRGGDTTPNDMPKNIQIDPRKFTVYTEKNIEKIPQLDRFSADQVLAMKAVAQVLPFRVNDYVIDELIDWNRVPDDPMFQLTFPQAGMLQQGELDQMMSLLKGSAERERIKSEARRIQLSLNPHPAGQKDMNVPNLDGVKVAGMQH
ncbi:MAG: hypothetical protein ACI89X_005101, partial [Planctomycetota bacterium]